VISSHCFVGASTLIVDGIALAKNSFLAHQCGAVFFREIECFGQIVSLPLAPHGASSGKAPKDFHPRHV
jgi:hypothetical protein